MRNDSYYDLNNKFGYNEFTNNSSKRYPKSQNTKLNKYLLIIFFTLLIFLVIVIFNNMNKEYTVVFDLNGADEIENKIVSCQSNIRGRCYITLPNAKKMMVKFWDIQVIHYLMMRHIK